ncbi:hypothetical protein SAY86_000520 [Trapa natans]|uniref:GATA transcription factor n=1 Tax=Trapa natans TaxID=22666 RepID=A0AAN7MC65_TRANT|nr:hypothetical protein SAY86_000520 [Trapa natans]
MEFMEAALKPSLCREMVASVEHVAGEEDSWFTELGVGASDAAAVGEDFSVDDLLDLSNGELDGGEPVEEEDDDDEDGEKDYLSLNYADGAGDDDGISNSGSLSSHDSESILASGLLTIPVDDIAELEWVSRFVEDSPSEFHLVDPISKWKPDKDVPQNRIEPDYLKPPHFPSPIPAKTRSERPRTGKQSSRSPPSPCLLSPIPQEPEGKPTKKMKKWAVGSGSVPSQRKCSHCGVQKTPQWRAGPLGAKTLCNACGVRYKSGRLFPEYRPACSPTFSMEVHSNSHRKVLEMRKKKGAASTGAESWVKMITQSL